MKPAAKVYTALIMLFLFAPIAILLVFSFNSAKSLSVMQGFSSTGTASSSVTPRPSPPCAIP